MNTFDPRSRHATEYVMFGARCWYRSDRTCATPRDCNAAGHCCELFHRPGVGLWMWEEPIQ